MGVKFKQYGGSARLVTQFSDNFVRADNTTLGANWMRFLATPTSSAGVTCSGQDALVSNTMALRCSGQNNPVGIYETFWTPAPVAFNLYTRNRTFCTVTESSTAGTVTLGQAVRFNVDLQLGAGTRDFDAYWLGPDGVVVRLNGGGTTQVIAAQGWTFAAGNIKTIRVSGTTSVLIETFLNGVAQATATDTTAFRIQRGYPGMLFRTAAGNTALVDVRFSAFSCGLF